MFRRVRRLARFAAVSMVLMGTVAGCTFLISFDDPDPATTTDASIVPDRTEAMVDGEKSLVDARATVDVLALNSCEPARTGHYCGDNQLDAYPFPDDLVSCDGGRVAQAVACPFDCVHLKNPHPDECDGCKSLKDGYYCGRDFGWSASNALVYVHCQSNAHDLIDFDCVSCTSATATAQGTAVCKK